MSKCQIEESVAQKWYLNILLQISFENYGNSNSVSTIHSYLKEFAKFSFRRLLSKKDSPLNVTNWLPEDLMLVNMRKPMANNSCNVRNAGAT